MTHDKHTQDTIQRVILGSSDETFEQLKSFADTEIRARELIDRGYRSTSNKFRTVARLPEGKTGMDALREASPKLYAEIMARTERYCASHYLRGHAEDSHELTPAEFRTFKRLGGPVA